MKVLRTALKSQALNYTKRTAFMLEIVAFATRLTTIHKPQ
jgi:hypothetical protein